jgi:hypothetical protein
MGFVPERVKYLRRAGTLLGHLQVNNIQQLGEPIASAKTSFAVLPTFRAMVK